MRQANSPQMPYPLTREWIEADQSDSATLYMDDEYETPANGTDAHGAYSYNEDNYDEYYQGFQEQDFRAPEVAPTYPYPESYYEPIQQPAPKASVNPALVAIVGVILVVTLLVGFALNIQRDPTARNRVLPSFGRNAQIPVTDFSEAEEVVWEGGGSIAPLFTKEVQYWSADIDRWAVQYDVDPNMVATIMQIESCGHPSVASIANAQGLFQVMPFHFTTGEVMTDPDTNAKRGINFLKEQLAYTGNNWRMTAAGYNGGYAASSNENNWVAETRSYVVWAEGIYADASAGSATSATLDRWLAAGGQSLCDKAAVAIASR